MVSTVKYGSGEYSPTPSHGLPAFVNGTATGYMCRDCGHIQRDLDPIFDDLCPVCLKNWALQNGVSRLLPTAEIVEETKALVPTAKVNLSNNFAEVPTIKMDLSNTFGEATTVIMSVTDYHKEKFTNKEDSNL